MVLYLAETAQPGTEICVHSQNMVQVPSPSFRTPYFTGSGVLLYSPLCFDFIKGFFH